MPSQPSLALVGNEAINWNAATAAEHATVWQLAARSCDHISFPPHQWKTWLTGPLAELAGFRLVAFATQEMGYPLEQYGLLGPWDYYPFDKDGVVAELLLFLYPEMDKTSLFELGETIGRWQPRKTAVLFPVYMPVRNPFNNWIACGENSATWKSVSTHMALQNILEENDSLVMLFSTQPLCMKDTQLLEAFVFSEFDRCFIRHYFFYTSDDDCLYIDGKSSVIFDAWQKNCFTLEDEEELKDYLRLFCWALQADQGQFLITEQYDRLPLRKRPEEFSLDDIKKIEFTVHIKGNRVNESGMAIGPGIKSADAVVVYDSSVYIADFAINTDTGEMEMLDDITQLNSTDLVNESFGKNRLARRSDPDVNLYVNVEPIETDPSLPVIKTQAEFFYELSDSGALSSRRIECSLRLVQADFQKYPSAANMDTIVFRHCRFSETVQLAEGFSSIPIRFEFCHFENGFSAAGARMNGSLSFSDCIFQSKGTNPLPGNNRVADLGYASIASELVFTRCRFTGTLNLYSMEAAQGMAIYGCSFTSTLVSRFLQETSIPTYRKGKRHVNFKLGDETIGFDDGFPAIILEKASIRGNLTIGSAEYPDAELASIVAGDIIANNMKVGGQVHFYGTLQLGTLHMEQMDLQGDCLFGYYNPARLYRIMKGSLRMDNSFCQQSIYFTHIQVEGTVSLYFLRCSANVNINSLLIGIEEQANNEDAFNLTFAEIKGMLVARHVLNDTSATYLTRPPLHVHGNVELSGSSIAHIQVCASIIEGDIDIRTGQFNSLQMGLGWRMESENAVREITSVVRKLSLENVTVTEDVNFTGLVIRRAQQNIVRRAETGRAGGADCRIRGCRIGGNLSFFNKEVFYSLLEALKRDSRGFPLRNLNMPETQKEVQTRVADNLEIEGTTIAGHLQLSNLDVGGVIRLNDSDIGFDIRMETGLQRSKSHAEKSNADSFDEEQWFQTRCMGLDMEKLDAGGDLLLDALKIRRSDFHEGDFEHLNGNLLASGAKIRGTVALVHEAFLAEYLRTRADKNEDPVACANVAGTICFTGMQADHLLLLAKNFENYDPVLSTPKAEAVLEPRLKLDRACFNKLEIISPTPLLDLTNISVQDWRFGDEQAGGQSSVLNRRQSESQLASKFLEILDQMHPFDKSVYVNVERKLRNESKETVANAIYRGMVKRAYSEQVSQSHPVAGALRKTGAFFHRIFMNYGTAFWLPLKWWLGIFIITIFTLSFARNIQLSQPVTNIVAVNDTIVKTGADAQTALYKMHTGQGDTIMLQMQTISRADISPNDWSKLDAAILASRYCIPFFDLSFQDEWQVAGHMELPVLLLSLLSYIFLSLFLYGVADKAFRKT